MDVTQYIKPELTLVIPICWGIGKVLKQTPKIPDWTIPYFLLFVGVFLSGLYVLAIEPLNPMSAFTACTQGALLAVASVGSNQLLKQAEKRDSE